MMAPPEHFYAEFAQLLRGVNDSVQAQHDAQQRQIEALEDIVRRLVDHIPVRHRAAVVATIVEEMRPMTAPVRNLAASVRALHAMIAKNSDKMAKRLDEANTRLDAGYAKVTTLVVEVEQAADEVHKAVDMSTNGGPPLDDVIFPDPANKSA